MDALQWMGAVRMRVQTADKKITIIHTTPVHQLTSCDAKSCVFERNKFIIKAFFNFKTVTFGQNTIPLSIIWFFPVKKKSLIWIRREICTDQALFTNKNVLKNMLVNFDVRGQQGMDVFTGGSIIMYYFAQKWRFRVKNWCTEVMWIIVMFLSAVWTLILTAPIHCRASIGEQVM